MRRISHITIIALLLHGIACAQDSVRIRGVIKDPVSDSIVVSYNDNALAYYPHDYYAHVDKKGNFSMSFPVPRGVYTGAALTHGRRAIELVLYAGYDLQLTATGALPDSTAHFTGKGSEVQNFISRRFLARGVTNMYNIKLRELMYNEPADFPGNIDKEKQAEYAALDADKSLPASFVQYRKAFYRYYNYFFLQQYPLTHEMLKKRKFTDTVPDANYAVMAQMPYAFNDSMMTVPSYLLYLTGVIEAKLAAAGYRFYNSDTAHRRELEDSVNTLAYRLMPAKSAEYFIAQCIYGRAAMQDAHRSRRQLDTFEKHWPHSEYTALLERQVATAERLAPGRPAPDIDITTPDGRKMKLSDLRGKVVYLNFWAKWCRQCVGEMINERKIKPLLKNQDVVFVYVSIDNDTAGDNKIIEKYKLDGLFTNANGWSSKEVQLYGVQVLPAYYIIDKHGNIGVRNAISPVQPEQMAIQIGIFLR